MSGTLGLRRNPKTCAAADCSQCAKPNARSCRNGKLWAWNNYDQSPSEARAQLFRSFWLLGAIGPQITRVCRPRVFSAKERVFVLLLCFACFLLKLLQSRTEIHANGEVYLVLTENQ